MDRKSEEWLSGLLRDQGHVMVEKKLDRLHDFALEFWMEATGEARYLGPSLFFTGARGNYLGNRIMPPIQIERELTRHAGTPFLPATCDRIARALQETLGGRYRGPLGIDMMLYRDAHGATKLHPCVEINSRYTMGFLSLALSSRHLSPTSEALFRVTRFTRPGEALHAVASRSASSPPRLTSGLLGSGYLPLTPVHAGTRFVAELTCREGAWAKENSR
jgi:hypothetical protein